MATDSATRQAFDAKPLEPVVPNRLRDPLYHVEDGAIPAIPDAGRMKNRMVLSLDNVWGNTTMGGSGGYRLAS